MLRIKALVGASLFAASMAHAADVRPSTFENEGQRYEYYSKLKGDSIRIDGVVVDSREKFSLLVKPSGWVTGNFGGRPVSYTVKKETRDRLAAKLKASEGIAVAEASGR